MMDLGRLQVSNKHIVKVMVLIKEKQQYTHEAVRAVQGVHGPLKHFINFTSPRLRT